MQGQKESGFNVSSAYVLKSDMESSSPVDAGSSSLGSSAEKTTPRPQQFMPTSPFGTQSRLTSLVDHSPRIDRLPRLV